MVLRRQPPTAVRTKSGALHASPYFFHAAVGGLSQSSLFVCACSPRYDNAPPALVAKLMQMGTWSKASPEHVGPPRLCDQPFHRSISAHVRVFRQVEVRPPQTWPTIGDR